MEIGKQKISEKILNFPSKLYLRTEIFSETPYANLYEYIMNKQKKNNQNSSNEQFSPSCFFPTGFNSHLTAQASGRP